MRTQKDKHLPSIMTTNSELSRLSNDVPLLDPDQDRLHRRPFAEHLAQSIRSIDPSDGFVFALTGSWGSGKTTVLNFTEKLLESHYGAGSDPVVIVHFKAWWLSGSDKLLQDFFQQFRSAINQQGTGIAGNLSSLSDSLAKYSAALEPLPYIGRFAAVVHRLGKLREAREADVNGLHRKIDEELKNFPGRIVVAIDDLDRLRSDEIRLVFRLVKAVANFPRTIYLLAYDEPVVIRAVGENDPRAGREYLDKIVQLPLALPAPDQPSLRGLFDQGLQEILADTQEHLLNPTELSILYFEAIKDLLTTPRQVHRLLNLLRATYPLVRNEVNAVDFIGIQALRQFTPTVYTFIASNKATFCRTPSAEPVPSEETQNESKYLENVLQSALESDWGKDHAAAERAVRNILAELFPGRAVTFGGLTSRSFYRDRLRENCSVCNEEVFDRYFFLGVPPGALSEAEFHATMSLLPDAEAFGNRLKKFALETSADGVSRARAFLHRLENAEQEVVRENYIKPFLRAMYSIGDELVIGSNDELVRKVTEKVLKQLPSQNDRFRLLQRIFREAEALFTLALHVHRFSRKHGGDSNQSFDLEADRTVGSEHLNKLKSLIVKRLRSAVHNDLLRKVPFLGFVLHRYADWASDAEAKTYVSRLIQSDEGLCDFLTGFSWQERIKPLDMERFLSYDPWKWVPRCKKILDTSPEWLTERHRAALHAYVRAVDNKRAQSGERIVGVTNTQGVVQGDDS